MKCGLCKKKTNLGFIKKLCLDCRNEMEGGEEKDGK